MLADTQSHQPLESSILFGGTIGTWQTVQRIRGLVDDAIRDPRVRRLAIEILRTSGADPHDDVSRARAIYEWIRANFYYVPDPSTKEMLHIHAEVPDGELDAAGGLFELRAGDCDDINGIVLPALLMAVGFDCRLVTIKADQANPDQYSHIFCEVLLHDSQGRPVWYPLDAARAGAAWDNPPRHWFDRTEWSLSEDFFSLGRLGRLGQDFLTDISQLAPDIGAATSGAAQIITASNTPPGIAAILSSPQAAQNAALLAQAGYQINPATGQLIYTGVSSSGTSSSLIWILLGLGVLVAVL
jgi:Transglutaminase-like superfamily